MSADSERLATLIEVAEADARREAKRARFTVVSLVGLVVFVAAYMTWIRTSLASLSAEDLTRQAGARIEEELPALQRQLADRTVAMAPEVVDRVETAVLDAPRAVRVEMEHQLHLHLAEMLHELEVEVDARLEAMLEEKLQQVEEKYPNMSDMDRLAALREDLFAEYRLRVSYLTDRVADGASLEMRRLTAHFRHLQEAGELDERQEIEKEILQVWTVLVLRHGITQGEER